jgi:hypothetical protein
VVVVVVDVDDVVVGATVVVVSATVVVVVTGAVEPSVDSVVGVEQAATEVATRNRRSTDRMGL